ncbi:MAG TPA: YraN family protein [Ruminococcaceae bacterium]|nr:YraN family protein [Oscillospiraceae bacterium]
MDNSSGALGEDYAAGFLKNKGYIIIERNYRSRFGEIDVIAADSKYIVFVEVKTRSPECMVSPFEAVTRAKQLKIIKTAACYLQKNPCRLQPRFDVMGVTAGGGKVFSAEYLENAFGCGSFG